MHVSVRFLSALAAAILLTLPGIGAAQSLADDQDRELDPLQPDVALVALPTTLRLPVFGSAVRVTHRFLRPLGEGDLGSLAEDLFGLDKGAQLGLEFRFGLAPRTQVGVHRTSDRTVALFAQYNLLQERDGHVLGLSLHGAIDGTNNFRDDYSPSAGLILSATAGELGTVYLQPLWVNNTNPLVKAPGIDNDTFLLGFGGRFRVAESLNVVAEFSSAPAGYSPGITRQAYAFEKVTERNVFQINVANSVATTVSEMARGAVSRQDWYLGFNITRKFF